MNAPWRAKRRPGRAGGYRPRRAGLHRRDHNRRRSVRTRLIVLTAVIAVTAGGYFAFTVASRPSRTTGLSTAVGSYLGLYVTGLPRSYNPVRQFVTATGVRPNLLLYYSAWWEPFRAKFAATAALHGAVPLVQINPENVRLSDIAAGRYDAYITRFASAIRGYRRPIIVGFGHEMNAQWSAWGYRHVPPATFVAAWRHIVDIFRTVKVPNVTWLWTINVIDAHSHSLPPRRWWPGPKYVDWVGIDGYYRKPGWRFAALFGPTIKAVHELTRDPILISETAVAPHAGKAEKIGNLFAGIRAYGLLGLVWFDAVGHQDWRLNDHAAIDAFHRAARATSVGQ